MALYYLWEYLQKYHSNTNKKQQEALLKHSINFEAILNLTIKKYPHPSTRETF